jgi:hypothetical protein
VRVPPAPIIALFLSLEPSILPVSLLTSFFHQPMAISAILVFIPLVPITAVAIIITVVRDRKSSHWREKRSAED